MVWHLIRRSLSCSSKLQVNNKKMLPVKILNVAEKNDAAKSLAEVMGRGRYNRREGFSKFNKIYEFEYMLMNQHCNMVMTSVSGHLLNFEFIGNYKKWNSCNPLSLFDIPVQKHCPDNFRDIKRTLETEIRGSQKLVIWTDGDREGENIGFEIIRVCKSVKPNIPVYRARFSEITPGAIQRACNNLLPPDERVNNAVDVRQELDLRIGAAFTRFQTQRLQRVFPNMLRDQLISYGSCQFPTLGFVVERYKQVQAFIPETFWKIKVSHQTDEGLVDFNWKRVRTFEHTACLVLYQICLEDPVATVTDVKGKNKTKWRPLPLDTVELEKSASRKLGINAKEAMKVAESLYTKGFISYPRTETNIFPKDINLNDLIQAQTQDPNWGEFASRVLEHGANPRNGKKTDQAHPPIHPIKYTGTLQGNDKKIYDFVVRHFLACCSKDAEGFETTVELEIAKEKFSASGLMVTAKNYLEVYPYEKWYGKLIPRFEVRQQFQPSSIEMVTGETSAPNLLSEADLIALMDKHGIGTDATHAEHIETIKSRMYVGVRQDGRFVPGELGMGLVEGYDSMGFDMSKPYLRAELEADLVKISEGKKTKEEVLTNQIKKYKDVFIEATNHATKIDDALQRYFGEERQQVQQNDVYGVVTPVRKCPNCRLDMTIKSKKDGNGFFLSCNGYPQCKAVVWFPESVLDASVDDSVCNTCRPSPVRKIKFKLKRGSVPPSIPLEYTTCIGCDREICQALGLQMRQNNPSANNNVRPAANIPISQPNNNRNRTIPRGGAAGTAIPNTSNRGNPTPRGGGGGGGVGGGGRSMHGGAATGNRGLGGAGRGGYMNNDHSARGGLGNAGGRPPLASLGQNSSGDTPDAKDIVCLCGEDALLLTVRKEGNNTGRQFYRCAKQQGDTCDFFLWADTPPSDGAGDQNRNRNQGYTSNLPNPGRQFRPPTTQSPGDAQCGCGQPAKLLTVSKEGENKGRQFHACPKPRGEGCNFFQWADQAGNTASGWGGHQNNFQNNRGPAPSSAANTKKKRKCGICHQEGHTRTKCPMKD